MCTLKVTSIWKAEKIQKTVQPFTKCWENSSKHCFCWFYYMCIAVYFTGFKSLLNITCILRIKFNQCDLQPHMYKQFNSHVISWGKRQESRKLRPQTSDFRHRKLRPLGKKQEKRFKLDSVLITWNVVWSRSVHGQHSERSEIFIADTSSRYKLQNWLQFEQHYSDTVFLFLQ